MGKVPKRRAIQIPYILSDDYSILLRVTRRLRLGLPHQKVQRSLDYRTFLRYVTLSYVLSIL